MNPFDDSSVQVGGLTIESAADRIALFGSVDITRSQDGLALARELQVRLTGIVATLEADEAGGHLPEHDRIEAPVQRANPFQNG